MSDLNESMKVIKGAESLKNGQNQYDKLKEDLLGKHAKKMNEILDRLDDKQFASIYPKILDYVAPRIQRNKGEIKKRDNTVKIIYGNEKKSAS